MTIDPHGLQQEPLFPTSISERQQMQEEHLDLLLRIAGATLQMKEDAKRRAGEIAGMRKKATQLEELLRASRPRK